MDRSKKKGKWLAKVTLKNLKERNKAWTKYQQFKSAKNCENYGKIRNEVNSMIKNDENSNRKLHFVYA